MKGDILLSISCITYNHEDYIAECIEGFLLQKTTFPIEILIHDDASTDGTVEIIKKYEKEYPELIKPFFQTNNVYSQGVRGINIKYNFPRALGKYIAICEGDDYWTDPLKLQKQVDFLEANPNYVLTFHPCHFLRMKNNLDPRIYREQPIDYLQYDYTVGNLLSKWGIPTASLVFRNEIKVIPSWFKRISSGDIALVMMLFEKGRFKLFEEHMSVYRITGKGESQTHKGYRMIHYRAILYSHLNEYFNYKYEKEIYEALDSIYHEFTKTSYSKNIGIRVIRRFKNYFFK